jgi:hypothetical protein
MDTVYITGIFVATLSVWVALVRLPNWCFRSIHRHRLWEERDIIADEILTRRLPKEHPAVRELLGVAEHSAKETHRLTILDLVFSRAMSRRCDTSKLSVLAAADAGLSEGQLVIVRAHRDRIMLLSIRSMLVGSWIGIFTILPRLLPAVTMEVRRNRQRSKRRVAESIKATLIVATDAARECINIEDSILIKGAGANGREPIGVR